MRRGLREDLHDDQDTIGLRRLGHCGICHRVREKEVVVA
jgi:hypothetical protein